MVGTGVTHSPLVAYGDALEREAVEAAERANKRQCYRKYEYEDLDSYRILTSSGRANFDRLMDAVDLYMDLTGFKFGYMQLRLFHEIVVTILRILYGDDLLPNLHDIEKRFAIDALRDVIAILYPRRAGKTKTQTIIAGAFAVSQRVGNCSCYNIGARQARDWLQESCDVAYVFKDTVKFGWTLDRKDTREFIQIITVFGTTNRISSYPGLFAGNANISKPACAPSTPRALLNVCVCVCVCVF